MTKELGSSLKPITLFCNGVVVMTESEMEDAYETQSTRYLETFIGYKGFLKPRHNFVVFFHADSRVRSFKNEKALRLYMEKYYSGDTDYTYIPVRYL